MTKKVLFALFALSLVAGAATTSIIKVSRLSDTQAAISCKNGADPTAHKEGDVLFISCGAR